MLPNIWSHGEMDITRVFGTRFEGSNPSGTTILVVKKSYTI